MNKINDLVRGVIRGEINDVLDDALFGRLSGFYVCSSESMGG